MDSAADDLMTASIGRSPRNDTSGGSDPPGSRSGAQADFHGLPLDNATKPASTEAQLRHPRVGLRQRLLHVLEPRRQVVHEGHMSQADHVQLANVRADRPARSPGMREILLRRHQIAAGGQSSKVYLPSQLEMLEIDENNQGDYQEAQSNHARPLDDAASCNERTTGPQHAGPPCFKWSTWILACD